MIWLIYSCGKAALSARSKPGRFRIRSESRVLSCLSCMDKYVYVIPSMEVTRGRGTIEGRRAQLACIDDSSRGRVLPA